VEEAPVSKRQKVESSSPALPPSVSASSDPCPVNANAHKLARAQDARRLPLELIDGFFVGSEGVHDRQPRSAGAVHSSPPLLPHRPWKHMSPARTVTEGILNNSGVRRRNDMQVQSEPCRTEPPQEAPKFMTERECGNNNPYQLRRLIKPTAEAADFAPWIGKHPEDVLNDQTVKHGFIDRMATSQNETNTARQSLYGLFKHKSGLQDLAALFASVVEERQAHSKISSSSTFKPPPRVTLTEAKRRAWLSDLANPGVPLRKLSRTIPQGIRGQSLLDQCLVNDVPTGRALWFAKCVGANEIRTLKRKGTSANFAAGTEIKWLRDWTSNIEQFLESSIEQCGQSGWRSRMNYILSLTLRLYSESLLDCDHYLDWIVTSISAASTDYLPVWLLMANLHKMDLIKHRKRGKMLTETLLEKLHAAMEVGRSQLAPLVGKLKHILMYFIHRSPACFVMPQLWRKYRGTVRQCLDMHAAPSRHILQLLSSRNGRLSINSGLNPPETRVPRRIVIEILDSARAPFNPSKIAQKCRSACEETDSLVNVVLEWCSSRFRTGNYRVYLVVRLLEIWLDELDVDSIAMDFLASKQTRSYCDPCGLRLLVSELLRAQIVPLSRYLQWLIARGGLLYDSDQISRITLSTNTGAENGRLRYLMGLDAIDVLTAAPLSSLSPPVKNLRDILLARAGFSLENEANLNRCCKDYVATQLPRIFLDSQATKSTSSFVPSFSDLSWSLRSEIASFLKQQIAVFRALGHEPTTCGSSQAESANHLTNTEFCVVRSILEGLGDVPGMVEILNLCISSEDEMLLSSITDTVNFQLDAFSALGQLTALHEQLFQTYISMRSSSGLPRQFVVSLISLSSLVPSDIVSVSSLQEDLARGDRGFAVAACSPVSDGMAESLQQAGPTFTEEFEAVLSSGNRMEEQTMDQLFHVLAERLEKGRYQTQAENDEVLCALHARLRIYKIAQFDSLFAAWLQRLFTTPRSRVKQLLPILISTSCVSFEVCVDILTDALAAEENHSHQASLMRNHVAIFMETISAAENGLDPVSYKLKLENARHVRENPGRAVDFRNKAGLGANESGVQLSKEALISLALNGQSLNRLMPRVPAEGIVSGVEDLLHSPFDIPNIAFTELVRKTTDLSTPFCRLGLQILDAIPSLTTPAGRESVVDTIFELAKTERNDAWTIYLTAVGRETASRIREKAEEAFFAVPLSPSSGRITPALSIANTIEQASTYLSIASRTAYTIPSGGVQAIVGLLIERFSIVLLGLMSARMPANNNDSTKRIANQPALYMEESKAGSIDHLTTYLTLLLGMTSMHKTALISTRAESLSSPTASQRQSQQDVVKILILLTKIATHPPLSVHPGVVNHVFDVAATIVDDVPEEVRTLCARILKDKMHDPQAEYLFGSANNSNGCISVHENAKTGWMAERLQIVKDGKRVGEYKSRNWEMLEGGAEASVSLSLFDTRREW
jgi:mediator of RNA polymerase II transcription subunit 12, fungi type